MKNLLKYAFLLGVSLSVFTACKENYDMSDVFEPDDVYAKNYVYTQGPAKNTYNYEFKASVDEDGTKSYQFLSDVVNDPLLIPAQSTKPAGSDLKVKFAIVPELLDSYNAANNSDWALLESATLERDVLTILKGEQMSADSLRVLYDETEFFNKKAHYAVPVRIVSAGSEGSVSENYKEFLLFFNAKYNTSAVAWSGTLSSKFNLMFDRGDGSVFNPTPSLEYPVTLKTQYAALEDNKVSVRINNDLVQVYNAANATAYAPLENVELTGGSEFTITAGETETSGNITLAFSDSMNSLEMGRSYLIPIEISDVEGYGAGVSESNNVYYIFISTIYTPNMAAADSATGTLIDRTNMTATYKTSPTSSYESNWTNYLTGKASSAGYMYTYYLYNIDLGAEYTLTSFEFNAYYYSYYDYYYAPKIFNIQVSTDKENWDDWGDSEELADGAQSFVKIRFPVPVRYLRLTAKEGWHGTYGAVVDGKKGMNFYQQEE